MEKSRKGKKISGEVEKIKELRESQKEQEKEKEKEQEQEKE